ncbi:MAG: SpoIIE family protein phosphatase [Holophagae bacterium]|nr:SpoIIE family protein phosphatase [Holophagae bacterium]
MGRVTRFFLKPLFSPFLITIGVFVVFLYYLTAFISWHFALISFGVFAFFTVSYLCLAWILKLIFKRIVGSVSLKLTAFFITTAILPLLMVLMLTATYLLFLVGVTESYMFTRVVRYAYHQRTGSQNTDLRFRTHGGKIYFEPEQGKQVELDSKFFGNVRELTGTDYTAAVIRVNALVNLNGEPVEASDAKDKKSVGAEKERFTMPIYSSIPDSNGGEKGTPLNFTLSWPYLTYPVVFPLEKNLGGPILAFMIRVDLKRFASNLFSGTNSFSKVNRELLIFVLSLSLAFALFQFYLLLKGLFFAVSMSTATRHLVRGVGEIRKGNFDSRIPELTDRNLGQVGVAVNEMAANMQQLFQEKMAGEQMAQELEVARKIQSSVLLQGVFGEEMYRIAVHSKASRVVGGDYCNFYKKETGLEILAGDVSGKGLGAAMYVSEVDGLFYGLAARHEPPEVIVEGLHQFFLDRGGGSSFFSATLLDICPEEGKIEYYRMGDPPLMVKRTDGKWYVSRPKGMIAGMRGVERVLPYLEKVTFPLEEVEGLFLYSDGFMELFPGGEPEIIRILAGLDLGNVEEAHAVLARIVDSHSSARELLDDVTVALVSFQIAHELEGREVMGERVKSDE